MMDMLYTRLAHRVARLGEEIQLNAPSIIILAELNLIIEACTQFSVNLI